MANLLELGYPGGPRIERLAREGEPRRFRFPRPLLQELERGGPNRYAFSFSGLKTAVLRAVRAERRRWSGTGPTSPAASRTRPSTCSWPRRRTRSRRSGYETAMIGGGVACNRALADRLRERLAGSARVSVASPRLNTDNAAMIAAAGAWRSPGASGAAGTSSRATTCRSRASSPASPSLFRKARMTVYPLKIPLPFWPHEITGYGIMMMVAFLVGGWLIARELRRRRLARTTRRTWWPRR